MSARLDWQSVRKHRWLFTGLFYIWLAFGSMALGQYLYDKYEFSMLEWIIGLWA